MNSFQHVWSQVSCSAELNLPREQVLRAQGLLNEKCRGRVWRHSPLSCAVTRSPESCATRDTVRQEVNPRRRNLTRNPPRIPFPREAVSCRLHVSALSPSTASPPPPKLSSLHPGLCQTKASPNFSRTIFLPPQPRRPWRVPNPSKNLFTQNIFSFTTIDHPPSKGQTHSGPGGPTLIPALACWSGLHASQILSTAKRATTKLILSGKKTPPCPFERKSTQRSLTSARAHDGAPNVK